MKKTRLTEAEIDQQIESTKASFAIEGLVLDEFDVAIARRILGGEIISDDEIFQKIAQDIQGSVKQA